MICPMCNIKCITDDDNFLIHVINNHFQDRIKEYLENWCVANGQKCKICHEDFDNSQKLIYHYCQTHFYDKIYEKLSNFVPFLICPNCNEGKFQTKQELINHFMNSHVAVKHNLIKQILLETGYDVSLQCPLCSFNPILQGIIQKPVLKTIFLTLFSLKILLGIS